MSQKDDEEKNLKTATNGRNGAFRRFFAQFVATTIKNMLLFDMSLCSAFPAIVIPALTGHQNEHNKSELLTLTAVQSSWIGSLVYVCEPFGSILSAFITDSLGRKWAMIVVNIPFAIAWLLLYNANDVWMIFVAITLMGLAIGLMESPVITYIGEICEPSYRGILIAYTNVSGTFGMLVVSVLNTLLPWRTVALVCLFVPILTVIALLFVPETPLWLLSKNRLTDAEKSLQWLRGWVSKTAVADEFQALQRYSHRSQSCVACIKQNQQICSHPAPTFVEKLREFKRKQTLKPFFIVIILFIIAEFCGTTGMGPFIAQIFDTYQSPIAPDQAQAILSVTNNLANVAFLCLIRFTGKRPLYLFMLTGAFLSSAVISGYGFAILPSGTNSFDKIVPKPLEMPGLAYIPFVCIILWNFSSNCGVNSVPWQMLSEVYPFKVRGIAAAISAAIDYFLSFLSTKTYLYLETSLSLPGISLLNCLICAIGLILMYKIMPETENRSLEDIEMHFADDSKQITDRHIGIVQSTPSNNQEIPCSSGTVIVTNDSSIQSHENNAIGSNSRNSGEQKLKCDSIKVYENRGFADDRLE